MDRRGLVRERPILIAMKGHPGSGKSTLATAIAKTLKCPLVDKDHFRDATYPTQQALSQASPTTASKLLNDLSYEAMWRVVSTQLGLGLSVVIDSPLSRKGQFDRLMDIASEGGGSVVVIECRPGDEAEWRRRLESRGKVGGEWHKPSTWTEMERLLEGYGGCWNYDVGNVPKIVVDTTAPVKLDKLLAKDPQVHRFDTLKYLATVESEEEILVVLQELGRLVKGLWVMKSSLLYGEKEELLLFRKSKKLTIKYSEIAESPPCISKAMEDVLHVMARERPVCSDWKVDESLDWSFIRNYCSVVNEQDREWESLEKHTMDKIKEIATTSKVSNEEDRVATLKVVQKDCSRSLPFQTWLYHQVWN